MKEIQEKKLIKKLSEEIEAGYIHDESPEIISEAEERYSDTIEYQGVIYQYDISYNPVTDKWSKPYNIYIVE